MISLTTLHLETVEIGLDSKLIEIFWILSRAMKTKR